VANSPLAGVMDNPYYDWSPLPSRPRLTWPREARIAVAVLLTLEHFEWYPPAGAALPPSIQYNPFGTYPDRPHVAISYVEYGNRVGVFRVLDVLDRYAIRPTVALDAQVAERAPFLVQYLKDRGAEFAGRGVASNRLIDQRLSERDERDWICTARQRLLEFTGAPPRGWHSPDYSESTRTVSLLAENGFDYVMDWPNDEQPCPMKVATGKMTNLPLMIELDDVRSLQVHAVTASYLQRVMMEQFDQLYHDAATTGRLFFVNVHPWLTGQPHRIRYFDAVMQHVMSHPGVWAATGSEIVDWFRSASGTE
jgi:peptidoglycan/xylan/chitin deacetylase (PgdA/CDA1 family)